MVCSDLVCSDLVCSDLVRSDLVCSDLVCSDLVCSDLMCSDLMCSDVLHMHLTACARCRIMVFLRSRDTAGANCRKPLRARAAARGLVGDVADAIRACARSAEFMAWPMGLAVDCDEIAVDSHCYSRLPRWATACCNRGCAVFETPRARAEALLPPLRAATAGARRAPLLLRARSLSVSAMRC